MKTEVSKLAGEIKKRHPFESPEEEAYLNLWRTFAELAEGLDRLLRRHGLCPTHYNVLRILAGAKAADGKGLPVLEVRERLITRVPDITRLVDKLADLGHVERVRTEADRRLVLLSLTASGEKLVADLRKPVFDLHRHQLGHLGRARLAELSGLLEEARARAGSEEFEISTPTKRGTS